LAGNKSDQMIAIPEISVDAVMANIGVGVFICWTLFYFKVILPLTIKEAKKAFGRNSKK